MNESRRSLGFLLALAAISFGSLHAAAADSIGPAPSDVASWINLLAVALPLISYGLVAALRKFYPATPDWLALSIGPALGAVTDYLTRYQGAAPSVQSALHILQSALYAGAATWIHEITKALRPLSPPPPFPPAPSAPAPPASPSNDGLTVITTYLLAWMSIVALLITGCATAPTTSPPDPGAAQSNQLARIEILSRLAAATGAQIDLREHPERRPYYVASRESLSTLIRDENWNPAAFTAALQNLPVKQLQGNNGSLIITTAVILYEETVGRQTTAADQAPYVRAFALGVRAGLDDALSTMPPPAMGTAPATGAVSGAPAGHAQARPEPAPDGIPIYATTSEQIRSTTTRFIEPR